MPDTNYRQERKWRVCKLASQQAHFSSPPQHAEVWISVCSCGTLAQRLLPCLWLGRECVGCASNTGAWGVCPAHTQQCQQATLPLFVLGEKEEKQKVSAPQALAKPSTSATCCVHFLSDQLELVLDEYYLPNTLFSKRWSSLLNMLFK